MGQLEHSATQATHTLSANHLVGRSHACGLRVSSPLVSAEHAVFRWNGVGWELRDLASSNGTFVDEQRLRSGQTIRLERGSRIAFGNAVDLYTLVDDSPPAACAYTPGGHIVHPVAGVLAIPSQDDCECLIHEQAPGKWFRALPDGGDEPVDHGRRLCVRGQWWELELPIILEPTKPSGVGDMFVGELRLLLEVSADEEDVSVTVIHRRGHFHLDSRASSYLLLMLARERLADQARPELADTEHGWLSREQLLDMLKSDITTPSRLNVEIYRIRNRFRKLGVKDASEIIERRPASLRLRLGVGNVEVVSHARKPGGR